MVLNNGYGVERILISGCGYYPSRYHSEGNGASFPIQGSVDTRPYGNHGNHRHDNGLVISDKIASDSEVEIYAVDDETLPLAASHLTVM